MKESNFVVAIRNGITKYGREMQDFDTLAKEAYQKGKMAEYHKYHRAYLLSAAKQDALMEVLNNRK